MLGLQHVATVAKASLISNLCCELLKLKTIVWRDNSKVDKFVDSDGLWTLDNYNQQVYNQLAYDGDWNNNIDTENDYYYDENDDADSSKVDNNTNDNNVVDNNTNDNNVVDKLTTTTASNLRPSACHFLGGSHFSEFPDLRIADNSGYPG